MNRNMLINVEGVRNCIVIVVEVQGKFTVLIIHVYLERELNNTHDDVW